MPTILRDGPYRFFFYSGDRDEPPHVHVERDDCEAKFWLNPIRLERSHGFSRKKLTRFGLSSRGASRLCWISGMNTSTVEARSATALAVVVDDDTLTVELTDGRTIAVPLAWYPRLLHGSNAERNQWHLIGQGRGIHWPDLDEDLSVQNLLDGKPSGESQRSLQNWQERRANR